MVTVFWSIWQINLFNLDSTFLMSLNLLPPVNEITGSNIFSHVWGGSHVTITHDTLDLTILGPLCTQPQPTHPDMGPHCTGAPLP